MEGLNVMKFIHHFYFLIKDVHMDFSVYSVKGLWIILEIRFMFAFHKPYFSLLSQNINFKQSTFEKMTFS